MEFEGSSLTRGDTTNSLRVFVFHWGEKPEIGNNLLLVKENNSNAVHLVHHGSKPDKPISDLTPPVKPHHKPQIANP